MLMFIVAMVTIMIMVMVVDEDGDDNDDQVLSFSNLPQLNHHNPPCRNSFSVKNASFSIVDR